MSSFDENDSGCSKDATNYEEVIELLSDKVDKLCRFSDYYFENHSIEDAIHKNGYVKQELDATLELLNKHQECTTHKHRAKYYYFKGRALNIEPNYSKEAEELLSKAVKLDPKLVEAWNELGKCYWKNNNLKEAENCFNGALHYGRNKISLRSLSMTTRQRYSDSQEEKRKLIETGLSLAKESVQLDPNDGQSWIVLGNAHLSSFFGICQSPKTLKQCLSAYLQAEKDVAAKSNPDLHYNKAVTLMYKEEFELALESFSLASAYEPAWDPPKLKIKQLTKYLEHVSDFVASCGKMKAKRLQQIIQSIDIKQLGPYSGGSYTSSSGETAKLDEIQLADLKTGLNEEKVVLGKVVCSVYNEDKVPFTFCLVNKLGTCVAVSVFNMAEGRGVIIGDSVAIPEPYVTDVNFKHKDKEFKFRLIRIETPCVMVVNGKKVGKDNQAGVQMSIFKKYT